MSPRYPGQDPPSSEEQWPEGWGPQSQPPRRPSDPAPNAWADRLASGESDAPRRPHRAERDDLRRARDDWQRAPKKERGRIRSAVFAFTGLTATAAVALVGIAKTTGVTPFGLGGPEGKPDQSNDRQDPRYVPNKPNSKTPGLTEASIPEQHWNTPGASGEPNRTLINAMPSIRVGWINRDGELVRGDPNKEGVEVELTSVGTGELDGGPVDLPKLRDVKIVDNDGNVIPGATTAAQVQSDDWVPGSTPPRKEAIAYSGQYPMSALVGNAKTFDVVATYDDPVSKTSKSVTVADDVTITPNGDSFDVRTTTEPRDLAWKSAQDRNVSRSTRSSDEGMGL